MIDLNEDNNQILNLNHQIKINMCFSPASNTGFLGGKAMEQREGDKVSFMCPEYGEKKI